MAVGRVVSPDGGAGSRRMGRLGFAVTAARRGSRRDGAIAANAPMEDVAQMTEPLTKEDLVTYLASGCKPKEDLRYATASARSDDLLLLCGGRGTNSVAGVEAVAGWCRGYRAYL